MRLTWKIAITIAVAICLVLGTDGYMRVSRQLMLFESDIRRDHLSMGRATAAALNEAWLSHGKDLALELIERISKKTKRVSVRWIPASAAKDLNVPIASHYSTTEVMTQGQVSNIIKTSPKGERFLHTYIPVIPEDVMVGVIEIAESLAPQKKYVRATVMRSVATTGVMIFICAVATFILGFLLVGRPVRALVEKAKRIGKGDFSMTQGFRHNDEISDLAEEMNTMAAHLDQAMKQVEYETTARLETLEQLRHADRLKTVGQLTSGVVHEIGTPLTVIAGRAKMISSGEVEGEEARDCARIVVEQTERVTKIIREILEFARRGEKQKSVEDINRITKNLVSLLSPVAVKRGIYLDFEDDGLASSLARIDHSQFQQVLANLIVNAIQAARPGGHVVTRLVKEDVVPPNSNTRNTEAYWVLSVKDDGEGISDDVMPHIFEPFYTTKTSGNGTGLGLAISRKIVQEHGGWFTVTSEPGKGSCFSIYLPVEAGEL